MGLERYIKDLEKEMNRYEKGSFQYDSIEFELKKPKEMYRQMVEIIHNAPTDQWDRYKNYLDKNPNDINRVQEFLGNCKIFPDLITIIEKNNVTKALDSLDRIHKIMGSRTADTETVEFLAEQGGKPGCEDILDCINKTPLEDVENGIVLGIVSAMDSEHMKVFEKYENTKHVAIAIYEMGKKTDIEGIRRLADLLSSEDVVNMYKYVTKDYDIITNQGLLINLCAIAHYTSNEVAIESAKVAQNVDKKQVTYVLACLHSAAKNVHSAGYITLMHQIFNKYNKYSKIIDKAITDWFSINVSELLHKNAYDYIERSIDKGAAIRKLIKTDYISIRSSIDDAIVSEELDYKDLDRMVSVENFIHEVHKRRDPDSLGKVHLGYYEELNRAVDQGRNLKEKIRYFRRYLNEVEQQMQDNVGELMYSAG